jgi:hypothetical protein
MKAKNNKAVQGIVAVSDAEQLEKIKKEVEALPNVNTDIKYWDYTEVLEVHEALQKANESINKLGLVLLWEKIDIFMRLKYKKWKYKLNFILY